MKSKGNVFINAEDLYQGKTAKIVYNGSLSKVEGADVYIHLGFGMMWDNLTEIKMSKTNEGYVAEVPMAKADSINFCFRDGNNNWDNNNTANYVFPLEKSETALAIREELSLETKRHLRRSYIWSKKIRLAVYKLLVYVPKLITGNYKRKLIED